MTQNFLDKGQYFYIIFYDSTLAMINQNLKKEATELLTPLSGL